MNTPTYYEYAHLLRIRPLIMNTQKKYDHFHMNNYSIDLSISRTKSSGYSHQTKPPLSHLYVCLSVSMYICLYLSVCLFFCLPVYMPVCLPIYVYVCMRVCLYVCLPVCMSICLYVYLFLFFLNVSHLLKQINYKKI